MERGDDCIWGDVRDGMLDLAEPLDVLSEGFIGFLGQVVEVADLVGMPESPLESADELVAQVRPRLDRIHGEVHQP